MEVDEKGNSFIIHERTPNKSFLKLRGVLKKAGIKNNEFFLRLYDEDLEYVDPYEIDESDNSLWELPNGKEFTTLELKAKVTQECFINPWYFWREVITLIVEGGTKKFEMHLGNLAQFYCLLNNFSLILLLPRQNFKTISAIAYYSYIYNFSTINSRFLFGNKSLDDSKLNVERLRLINNALPSYLVQKHRKDIDNKETMQSFINNNTVVALPTGNDEAAADKLGRGNTSANMYYDESAFTKYFQIMLNAAAPASGQARIEAANNGTPYGRMITTTPNLLNIPEGKFTYNLIEEACKWRLEFYDWDIDDVKAFQKANATNDFFHIQYSYKELGRSEEWFDDQKRSLNNDLMQIKKELLIQWVNASDVSPFTEEQLDRVEQFMKPVLRRHFWKNTFELRFYEDFDRNDLVFIGSDVAGGLLKDNSTIVVYNPHTKKIIMDFSSPRINTDLFYILFTYIIDFFFPNSVLFIERNSYGKTIIDRFLGSVHSSKLFKYVKEKDQTVKKRVSMTKKQMDADDTIIYGINTDAGSRPKILDVLNLIVDDEPELIQIDKIFKDIKDLERKSNGKIEHMKGAHDDTLFAFLMIMYPMYELYKFVKPFLNSERNKEVVKNISNIQLNMSNDVAIQQMNIEHMRMAEQHQQMLVNSGLIESPKKTVAGKMRAISMLNNMHNN